MAAAAAAAAAATPPWAELALPFQSRGSFSVAMIAILIHESPTERVLHLNRNITVEARPILTVGFLCY